MGDAEHKAVFLSYASQDAEAARRICEALRAAGVEVWFDQSELRGGDAWDAKIRKQITACALFVPVISAATQARREGYFRLEGKLAVGRSHLLADDHPLLFPIAIGEVSEAIARVPDKFRDAAAARRDSGRTGVAGCHNPHRSGGRPHRSRTFARPGAWALIAEGKATGAVPQPRSNSLQEGVTKR